ncbi:hypothetical protein Esi_0029_0076 [Ectocarpus siliculosus]|uniref:Secreted protein n=1 Tax=Ectocarpus siliculosus TaxID=2880 RepID=D7FVC0_ECTSI|nr:hypothetical protein Esi_0029_0076 [Ectocarpus siliculosus]|eukprot:CBJ26292.1 hypothetical protein Esi_0029_0076 [Ectocarpus siliculosus]
MTQGGMRCMCILVETLDVVACVEANRQLGARGRRTAGALGRSSQLAAVPLAPPPRRRHKRQVKASINAECCRGPRRAP